MKVGKKTRIIVAGVINQYAAHPTTHYLLSLIAVIIPVKSPEIKVISLAAIARTVPVSIAIPTSA